MAYDLVLRGATVIDPSQDLNARRDVAVRDGRIAAVAERVEAPDSESIALDGKILTPTSTPARPPGASNPTPTAWPPG